MDKDINFKPPISLEKQLFLYKGILTRVVDGDTIKGTLDLGFDTWKCVTIRIAGIDTPEVRTRDLEEKAAGVLSKEEVIRIFNAYGPDFYFKSHKIGKFGRPLGEVLVKVSKEGYCNIGTHLLNNNLAEIYNG
jgi:micrococcal nuclease